MQILMRNGQENTGEDRRVQLTTLRKLPAEQGLGVPGALLERTCNAVFSGCNHRPPPAAMGRHRMSVARQLPEPFREPPLMQPPTERCQPRSRAPYVAPVLHHRCGCALIGYGPVKFAPGFSQAVAKGVGRGARRCAAPYPMLTLSFRRGSARRRSARRVCLLGAQGCQLGPVPTLGSQALCARP